VTTVVPTEERTKAAIANTERAARATVIANVPEGEARDEILAMLFPSPTATRDVPLSQMGEGIPVPIELREVVLQLNAQGLSNSAIQEQTLLSRQAISGVISGARRRTAAAR
jgi:hypothetical protein